MVSYSKNVNIITFTPSHRFEVLMKFSFMIFCKIAIFVLLWDPALCIKEYIIISFPMKSCLRP